MVESKIERLRISWESGARTDEAAYRRDVAELRAELDRIRSTPEPSFTKQARRLTSLADGWDQMRPDQRKRLLATMFSELVMKDGRLEAATPVPDWLPYLERVVPSEGLVGIEHTDGLRLEIEDGRLRRAA